MGILAEVVRTIGSVAGKAAIEIVKTGYQVGKATGTGVVKGTTEVVKEIAKKATGS